MNIWTYALAGVFALTALFIYLIPTVIVMTNKHPKRWLTSLLNVLLGFTVLGWIACLLWATARTPVEEK